MVEKNTPIFDVDDLGFFNALGLGLRHVELELGKKECQEGGNGDAVSLANYGRGQDDDNTNFSILTCLQFQEKLEKFILNSYANFHIANNHYNDAAFLLLDRDKDARIPYDFRAYPLGKCGKTKFSKTQVLITLTTEEYQNECINHAVANTINNLKEVLRKFKIQKTQELLERANLIPYSSRQQELYNFIFTILAYYQKNILIERSLFKPIYTFLKNENKLADNNCFDDLLTSLKTNLQTIQLENKKGDSTISVIHETVNFNQLTIEQLKCKLIYYIQNQNHAKVKECLTRLPQHIFTSNEISPLQIAAQHSDTDILKSVSEYDPNCYDDLLKNPERSTPIFLAAYSSQLNNLNFLLNTKKLVPKDIIFKESHIFSMSASKSNSIGYEIIKLLISHGVAIGNEIITMDDNPLAKCVVQANEFSVKILELMLPLADFRSKFLAIISATNELYYSYGHGARKKNPNDAFKDHIASLQALRNMILLSLTKEECLQIRELIGKFPLTNCKGETILKNDLFECELDQAKISGNFKLAGIIQSIFTDTPNSEFTAEKKQSDFFPPQKIHGEPKSNPDEKSNQCRII